MKRGSLTLLLAALFLAAPLGAQEHAADTVAAAGHETGKFDIITPHITNGDHMELPYWKFPWFVEVELPHWKPVHIGGLELDMSPSKHVVFLMIGAAVLFLVMLLVARVLVRVREEGEAPKGFANAIEAMVLYIRDEVILPNVGHHGEGFVPYLLTAFFFILTLNLLGLVPFGSTATGNISVTATLAILTFITVEVAGIRAQGLHYLSTMFYWNKEMGLPMRVIMFLIMSPVEIIGKITKPFALAIRLFANMTAGHIVVLAFVGLIFTFASLDNIVLRGVAMGAPFVMAVAIMVLELFVAFLQAFVFTLLSSVFIGQIREAHH